MMIYLTDRRDGTPKQAVEVEGKITHAHVAYRDPRLAGLTDEEFRALSAVLPDLAIGLPDTPHISNTISRRGERRCLLCSFGFRKAELIGNKKVCRSKHDSARIARSRSDANLRSQDTQRF
jgi:hypothetical protein